MLAQQTHDAGLWSLRTPTAQAVTLVWNIFLTIFTYVSTCSIFVMTGLLLNTYSFSIGSLWYGSFW